LPFSNATSQKLNEGGIGKMARFNIPKGCSLFQRRSDGRWESTIMVGGKQISVACRKDKQIVYTLLMRAVNENKKKTKAKRDKDITLFAWLDHWHKVFRLPKEGTDLSKNTIIMDQSMIRKIKRVFKDVKLKDLTADYIQQTLYSMTQGRTCEGVYTILKLALAKAKDRTGGISIMDMVEKVKHKRITGRALSKEEIQQLLEAARSETERDIIKVYIYTGCRVDELTRIFVKHINFEKNEIHIDGTNTKLSKRTMPIMPQIKPVLERLTADRDGEENLFNYTFPMITYFYRLIKKATGISFTLKDFRHTAATIFKDAGIPSSVYFRWFGWCDDTMAKRVYTHVTDFEQQVSQEWAGKFESPR